MTPFTLTSMNDESRKRKSYIHDAMVRKHSGSGILLSTFDNDWKPEVKIIDIRLRGVET